MSPPRLRLVDATPPEAEAPPAKFWQGDDDTFFHRRQIRVGVRLACFGRLDHGAVYEVVEVRRERGQSGRLYLVPSGEVGHLSDVVVLRRLGSNENRSASFQRLSYSAIWRLA